MAQLNLDTTRMAGTNSETIIHEDGAIVLILRGWLPEDYAQTFHDLLADHLDWVARDMHMYGKTIPIPRTMFFLGDDHVKTYRYSRMSFPIIPWNNPTGQEDRDALYKAVEGIRDRIRDDGVLRDTTREWDSSPNPFDSCLINHYRDGMDKIDAHSDKEALGPFNAVVTVSLGASRQFILRSKSKGANGKYTTIKTALNNGDLVLMAGTCQEKWTRAIPREPEIKTSRISLTYRAIAPV